MWLDTKRKERLAQARFYPVLPIPYIYIYIYIYVYIYIYIYIYMYIYIFVFRQIVLSEQSIVMCIQIEILLLSYCVLYIPY